MLPDHIVLLVFNVLEKWRKHNKPQDHRITHWRRISVPDMASWSTESSLPGVLY